MTKFLWRVVSIVKRQTCDKKLQNLKKSGKVKVEMKACLRALFVGDALASPAHWYYSVDQLRKDHGVIKGFVAPLEKMRGSIMNLSSTGGGGRGRDDGDIIGTVINHGKKKYWMRGGTFFVVFENFRKLIFCTCLKATFIIIAH